jgi:RimJ/RimL family protein N-acetyltransferase
MYDSDAPPSGCSAPVRVLQTAALRAVGAGDAGFIQKLLESMAAMAITNLPDTIPAHAGQQYVELSRGGWELQGWAPFIIECGDTRAGLLVMEPDALCGEGEWALFYYLLPGFWGQGVATRAVHEATLLAFGEMGLLSLCARCQADHGASLRVLQKNGFMEVGRQTNDGTYGSRTLGDEVVILRRYPSDPPAGPAP